MKSCVCFILPSLTLKYSYFFVYFRCTVLRFCVVFVLVLQFYRVN